MKQFLSLLLLSMCLTATASELDTNAPEEQNQTSQPQLGRKLTDYASTPRFGGYFIGKYAHSGDGFSQRFIRCYVDGTILTDFTYRFQAQVSNSSFHMKDYFLEWKHWKELAVKVGQYKRAFLFENPYNPWDVGSGDYAQITREMAGIGQKDGSVANGGRDQGLQVQGDLFPAKSDGHRYLHYQFQIMNGQGINAADADSEKDFLGTIQFQPIKDLYIGLFGWSATYKCYDRNKRWAAALKYEHNDWSIRAEYAHSSGHSITDYNEQTGTLSGTGKTDGWYATVGVPCTPWLKVYAKYDVYRRQANKDTMKAIYSISPNFQIHNNLLMQLQYNRVHDNNRADPDYNEIWAELYVRF